MMRITNGRLYLLVATWGLFLGMIAGACSDRSGAPSRSAAVLEANLPAPPDVPLRQAAPVTDDLRRVWLPLVRELAIAPEVQEPELWLGLGVDDAGRTYTVNMAAGQVLVFDAEGEAVARWGDTGEDKLEVPAALAVAGDEVFVAELLTPPVLSVWSLSGERLRARQMDRYMSTLVGLEPHLVIARFMEFGPLPTTVSALSSEGEELARIAELPTVEALAADRETRALWPDPTFAAGGGRVYVSGTDAYEVIAFDAAGSALWAVRVPWLRQPIPEELIQRSLERSRRAGRAMRTNVANIQNEGWPDYFPALSNIAADGHGRLYVFPYVRQAKSRRSFPVDIYSPEGELLLNATLPFQGWDAARGDHIYRLEEFAGNSQIVRYRIDLLPTRPAVTATHATSAPGY